MLRQGQHQHSDSHSETKADAHIGLHVRWTVAPAPVVVRLDGANVVEAKRCRYTRCQTSVEPDLFRVRSEWDAMV